MHDCLVIESQDDSRWKGQQEVSSSVTQSKRVSYEMRRGCSELYPVVLETSKERDYTTPLGSLFHCFTVLVLGGKKKKSIFTFLFFPFKWHFSSFQMSCHLRKSMTEQKSNVEEWLQTRNNFHINKSHRLSLLIAKQIIRLIKIREVVSNMEKVNWQDVLQSSHKRKLQSIHWDDQRAYLKQNDFVFSN